ncbi:hypothetical protein SAMN03159341_11471 [Paenibacillus sp. 1_12]|uniref:hypothetical protein n=1 Tax=Paenibacillus sp. 1_12 TaxID=1566278 RepID=UPI0008E807EC|nr:hypothetical protein [Paenibacillus sp. 1_12]SFM02484.1 hypothetical protein SAMN03159341_11471 [Paenibacillus sp. 1_12]
MIGNVHKALWVCSSGAPILIAFSAAWLLGKSTYTIPVIFLSVAVLLIVLALISFYAMENRLAVIAVRVKKVTPNDKIMIQYALSYVLPFTSIVWDKINPFMSLIVSAVVLMVLLLAHSPTANPLLYGMGYHFYEVETENGIGSYTVISKRAIRNKDELTTVIRITEYLLLDRSGGR